MRVTLSDSYRIESCVSRNDYSTLYRATDLRSQTPVAIKALETPGWLTTREAAAYRESVSRTIVLLAGFQHPQLGSLHTAPGDSYPLYVREWIDGKPLSALLQEGSLSLGRTQQIVLQTAEALNALSRNGLRHGAVLPDNVIFSHTGDIHLTDAGFSFTASRRDVAGVSCCYSNTSCRKSDLRMLAELALHCLTGRPLEEGSRDAVRELSLPAQAAHALRVALADRRAFRTPVEFAEALVPAYRPQLFQHVWRPAAAAGLVCSLATMGGDALSADKQAHKHGLQTVKQEAAVQAVVPSYVLPLERLIPEDRQAVELAVRRQGVAALAHPAIADVFGLSEAQSLKILDCLREQKTAINRMVEDAVNVNPGGFQSGMRTLREKTTTQILLLLDTNQRTGWNTLINAEPADGEPLI